MSDRSKVIWSEGLFLRPQHFQQQERYLEAYVEGRAGSLRADGWGFDELEIDRDLLTIGKLAIRRARGVFPDGTPFSIPDRDPPPTPLEVPPDLRNARVYLALPLRRGGGLDSDRRSGAEGGLVRQMVRELELRDATVESPATALVEVGGLRMRLLATGTPTEDFACIAFAHVQECRVDRQVLLDERFMPTVLRITACPPLATFVKELYGLLHQRGDALANVVTGTDRGGVSGVREFLRFQAINRYEPLIQHFTRLAVLHPEDLYRWLIVIAGDLAGLGKEGRRPIEFPAYQHNDLRASFEPTIAALRGYLDDKLISDVVSIPVDLVQPNVYLARINDTSLIDGAVFFLAAKAALPPEEIRRRIPQMVTIAPAVRLKELVEGVVPGLTLSPLAQIPPRIPFLAGYVYFEVDRSGALWKDMKGSGAFGLFVGEGFTNLAFSMWAIRGS
jgi:type VI secretion system protein ImpJ